MSLTKSEEAQSVRLLLLLNTNIRNLLNLVDKSFQRCSHRASLNDCNNRADQRSGREQDERRSPSCSRNVEEIVERTSAQSGDKRDEQGHGSNPTSSCGDGVEMLAEAQFQSVGGDHDNFLCEIRMNNAILGKLRTKSLKKLRFRREGSVTHVELFSVDGAAGVADSEGACLSRPSWPRE